MHVLDTEEDPKLGAAIAATNRRLPADAQLPIPQGAPPPAAPVSGKSP